MGANVGAEGARPPLICVLGPTASGKTALAIALAQQLNGEIVIMDSAQIYAGVDIGAAKPTAAEQAQVPHHLLGVYAWEQVCTAADWATRASAHIADICARGRQPILCGGTFLYLRALIEGFHDLPATPPELRQQFQREHQRQGQAALYAQLQQQDPQTAASIHPNDSQRTLRALEILSLQGQGRAASVAAGQRRPLWQGSVHKIAVLPGDRAQLRARIAQRFDQMVAAGLWDEVKAIRSSSNYNPDLPVLKALGYRQLFAALEGQVSEQEAIDKAITASRQYAKRQLTWLRKDSEVVWFDSSQTNCYRQVLNYLEQAGNPAD